MSALLMSVSVILDVSQRPCRDAGECIIFLSRDVKSPQDVFFYKFSSNVCLGGFAGSEPSLSIACCAGPDPTTRSRNSSAMAEFYPNV